MSLREHKYQPGRVGLNRLLKLNREVCERCREESGTPHYDDFWDDEGRVWCPRSEWASGGAQRMEGVPNGCPYIAEHLVSQSEESATMADGRIASATVDDILDIWRKRVSYTFKSERLRIKFLECCDAVQRGEVSIEAPPRILAQGTLRASRGYAREMTAQLRDASGLDEDDDIVRVPVLSVGPEVRSGLSERHG